MRTVLRNNYTPQLGDYHERLVIDEAQSNTWLFDCDGVYKRINWKVWNEAGDHETDGISQAYVTKEFNRVDDELSIEAATREAEDEALHQEIVDHEYEVERALEKEKEERVAADEAEAAARTEAVKKEKEERVAADEAEATARAEAIEQEATERKAADTALDGRVSQNAAAITSLQNAGLYRGTFDTLEDVPTTTKDDKFIYGEIYNNDFVTVRNAEHEGERGVARYRAVVEGATVTYVFETFIDKEINLWEVDQPGLIVGASGDFTSSNGKPGYIGVDPETHQGFVNGGGSFYYVWGGSFEVKSLTASLNIGYRAISLAGKGLDNNYTIPAATTEKAGVMTATDKTNLDSAVTQLEGLEEALNKINNTEGI